MAKLRTVPIAGRAPREVKDLAEIATRLDGHRSLSQFVGEAVRKEALRTIIRRGIEDDAEEEDR